MRENSGLSLRRSKNTLQTKATSRQFQALILKMAMHFAGSVRGPLTWRSVQPVRLAPLVMS